METNSIFANESPELTPLVNPEAEAATLGSMLIDDDAINIVSGILKVGDFYRERDNWIYGAILELDAANLSIDFVSLTDILTRNDQLDQIGIGYIAGLANATPTHVHAAHYANIVKKNSLRRKIAAAAQEMVKFAYDIEMDVEDVLSKVDSLITGVIDASVVDEHTHTLADLSVAEIERIDLAAQRRAAGLPVTDDVYSGLDIDKMLSGWERTRLYTIGGRPGMGKSAFGFQIAYDMAKRGYRVVAFSAEMSAAQVQRRLLSQSTGISVDKLKQADLDDGEWLILMEATNELNQLPLKINDAPTISPRLIRSICRREKRVHGALDCVLIDYMQLLVGDAKSENKQIEISNISRALKQLARELNCPVIVLSQLNRGVEGRTEKRPTLSDLRDSGAVEQDSDVVMFVYRDEYYDPDTISKNIIEVITAKNRDGKTGTTNQYFDAELTRVRNVERRELEY